LLEVTGSFRAFHRDRAMASDRARPRRSGARRRGRPAELVPTWEDVAREHGSFIYTVAYRLTGSRDDAQDLVQEVLLRVRRGLETYKPGSMHGWLARITTNAFLDDVRRRKRRPADALPEDPDWVLPPSMAADEALSHRSLPDEVQKAITDLPEDYRVAVVYSDVVGMSYQEISDALGVPIGTVRSRIHRGRDRLRTALS